MSEKEFNESAVAEQAEKTEVDYLAEGHTMPVKSIRPKDLTIKFLQQTKEWDGISIERCYKVASENLDDVMKLINNMRVGISRIRAAYRANGRGVPMFQFTSRVEKLAEETHFGQPTYKITLGKANSAHSINRQLIEELL